MTQHQELLPCKECGGKAILKAAMWTDTPYIVECSDFNCNPFHATPDAAITEWNKRQGS